MHPLFRAWLIGASLIAGVVIAMLGLGYGLHWLGVGPADFVILMTTMLMIFPHALWVRDGLLFPGYSWLPVALLQWAIVALPLGIAVEGRRLAIKLVGTILAIFATMFIIVFLTTLFSVKWAIDYP